MSVGVQVGKDVLGVCVYRFRWMFQLCVGVQIRMDVSCVCVQV